MPKFKIRFPVDLAVRLYHTIEVEDDDEELARAQAAIRLRRIEGQPNLFGYVCPNRDETMRSFEILTTERNPFSKASFGHAVVLTKEVKDA